MNAPSLSLLVMVQKDPRRVRALLELMRDRVDEIVVTAHDEATIRQLDDIVDHAITIDPGPQNRHLAWLFRECRCDWILLIDDDEVPSIDFVDALPKLMADPDVTNFQVPRRWLYPSPETYITAGPWFPDMQIRLLRNVPALWEFLGVIHIPVSVLGPFDVAPGCVYHFAPLFLPLDERRVKRERYEAARPGVVNNGFPVNYLHTPDEFADLPLAGIPDADRASIEAFWMGTDRPAAARVRALRSAGTLDSCDRASGTRRFRDDAYEGSTRLIDQPVTLVADAITMHWCEVSNLGSEFWDAAGRCGVFLSYHWLNSSGEVVVHDGFRSPLGARVGPGQRRTSGMVVQAPSEAGEYLFVPAIVREGHRWFGEGAAVPVSVHTPTSSSPCPARFTHSVSQ